MTSAPEFRRFDGSGARLIRSVVEAIFRGAYVDDIEAEDPFDTPEAFMGRFDAYTANPQLDLLVAYLGGNPVGQAWGWPLGSGSRWWEGLSGEPEPGFTDEDGARTFALSEIMVIKEFTGQGIAHALHDELLRARSERRATLLAEPDNTNAYRAYLQWGWKRVSSLRPKWPDAPTFDVLVLPLPLLPRSGTTPRFEVAGGSFAFAASVPSVGAAAPARIWAADTGGKCETEAPGS